MGLTIYDLLWFNLGGLVFYLVIRALLKNYFLSAHNLLAGR